MVMRLTCLVQMIHLEDQAPPWYILSWKKNSRAFIICTTSSGPWSCFQGHFRNKRSRSAGSVVNSHWLVRKSRMWANWLCKIRFAGKAVYDDSKQKSSNKPFFFHGDLLFLLLWVPFCSDQWHYSLLKQSRMFLADSLMGRWCMEKLGLIGAGQQITLSGKYLVKLP